MIRYLLPLCAALLALTASTASAQSYFEEAQLSDASFASPERYLLELGGGPYRPDGIDGYFGKDNGPVFHVEFDVIALQLPDVLQLGIGGRLGVGSYAGKVQAADGTTLDQEESMLLLPAAAMLTLRVDALPRLLSVPFVFTGRVGYEFTLFNADSAGGANGWESNHGVRWGVQGALELDFFDRQAARSLDEEWGINHSYIFFDYGGVMTVEDQPLDLADTSWSLGLGFVL